MTHPAQVHPRKLTADDRKDMPSDGKRWEILEGEPVVSPTPSTRHQRILMELIIQLAGLRKQGELLCAPVDVILDESTVCQPDIVYVSAARAAIVETDAIHGAPDLVIEILSPSTRRNDLVLKSRLYAAAGVGSYWIVDPDLDRIDVLVRAGAGWTTPVVGTSPEVFTPPGLDVRLALRDVFGR